MVQFARLETVACVKRRETDEPEVYFMLQFTGIAAYILGHVNGMPMQQTITMTSGASTDAPTLENFEISPETYTVGEHFDVVFQWSQRPGVPVETPVSFIQPKPAPDDWNILDNFIFEGADLGTPNLYRKTDNIFPTAAIPKPLPSGMDTRRLRFHYRGGQRFFLDASAVKHLPFTVGTL